MLEISKQRFVGADNNQGDPHNVLRFSSFAECVGLCVQRAVIESQGLENNAGDQADEQLCRSDSWSSSQPRTGSTKYAWVRDAQSGATYRRRSLWTEPPRDSSDIVIGG